MSSLVTLLRSAANDDPDRRAFSFVRDGSRVERTLTFGALDLRARTIAVHLQSLTGPHSRVLLVHPPGLGLMEALFGCLYAGMIAVPAPVPGRDFTLERVAGLVRDAQPVVALTESSALPRLVTAMAEHPALAALPCIAADELATDDADCWVVPTVRRGDPALLQYTSGSTSDPKGVVVSHGNLLAHADSVDVGWDHGRDSVIVSWLPMFHDMGLIYCGLQPIARRFHGVIMSPAEFVRRPLSWLEAISHFRGTHTASPNFGYELCTVRVTDEQAAALDLSSLKCAANGAEPVRNETMVRFAQKFAPSGLRPDALCPAYGMAENTLKISTSPTTRPPVTTWVDAAALEQGRVRVVPDRQGRAIVGCGVPGPETDVAIVDPERRTPCDEATIGEIWVRGPLTTDGYWGRNAGEVTTETFAAFTSTGDGPYLRTGDLGFMREHEVYVTGRLRDLIVIRGRNHHPSDIEFTVQQADLALEPSRGAAFRVDMPRGEDLVIVHEMTRVGRRADPEQIFSRVVEAVSRDHGVVPAAIVLLRPNALPITSSGKVRRQATKRAFEANELRVIARWDRPVVADDANSAIHPGVLTDGDTLGWLIHCAAGLLGIRAEDVPADEPLARLGFDSLIAEQLAGQIEEHFGREFSPALFFEHSTLRQVRDHLADAPDGRRRIAAPKESHDEIAIIGMACRFPGAPDLAAFWRLLDEGRCAIGEVPADRSHLIEFFASADGANVPSRGGYLPAIDTFDADLFRISPAEAESIDPQHRLLLEVCWEALESTGSSPLGWDGRPVGVFVGASTNDYVTLMRRDGAITETRWATGSAGSMAANRLSYHFNWHGPSLTVDTACSSSLVAVHHAVRSLRNGECELAVAGGVNVILDPQVTAAFADAGMLAPDGLCKTFDGTADGYVRGEGCGVVVLQRLADARRDGRRVRASICGSAVNQDGRSNGITAPNGRAQVAVVCAALDDAGVDASSVSLIEAHGTGTQLGDPVEVRALYEALGLEQPAATRPILGSVKTNIGHLEAAAGVAGLIKAALALDHRRIPAHLHWRSENEHMGGRHAAFDIPTSSRDWHAHDGSPRRAGVSSFGFGGTNAHVVLTEAPEAPIPPVEDSSGPYLLTLSGHTSSARRVVAERWHHFLAANPHLSASLVERHVHLSGPHLRHRLALVAPTVEAMTIGLREWLAERPSDVKVGCGPNRPDELVDASARQAIADISRTDPAAPRDPHLLEQLADAYVNGSSAPFRDLHPGPPVVALDFPAYPFQRKPYWYRNGQLPQPTAAPAAPARAGEPDDFAGRLAQIVAALLRVEPEDVDRDQHFLEMGADSIMMARALREVEDTFGVRIAVSQLFEELTTLNAVAGYLADRAPASLGPSASRTESLEGHVALTLAEQEQALAEMSERWRELRRSLRGATGGWTEVPAGAPPRAEPAARPALPPWRPDVDDRARVDGRRQEHIDELVRTLGSATAGSKGWTREHRPHLADNRAVAGFRPSVKELVYPILGDRAEGAWVWDIDGNRYLDLTMGFGVNLFGHAPAHVTAALRTQLDSGYALGPQHVLAGEVARMVTEMTGTDRVAFCNTGTEAVMTALRLARAATGRSKVAIFEGSYHGHFDGVLARARDEGSRIRAEPVAAGITPGQVADLLPLPYGSERSLAILRAEAPNLAAILVEPVQSRHPALQPVGFLRELRTLATTSGAILIFDETITGFRVAAGGAQEHFGVRADVCTYGKILGGGMPIGAVAGSRRVLDALDGGQWDYGDDSYPAVETTFFAGTFNKHPLALAASRATLHAIREGGPELYRSLNDRTARLASELNQVFADEQAAIRVEQFGSLFRFAFDDNQDVFIYHLLARGLYIWEGRNCFMSTAHGDSEVDQIVAAVRETLHLMRDGGLLAPKVVASRSPVERSAVPAPPPAQVTPQQSTPLTPAQLQLCMLAEMSETASAAYNETVVLRFAEPLDIERVRDGIEHVVRRHPALRTVIDAERGEQRMLDHHRPCITEMAIGRAGEWPDLGDVVAEPFVLSAGPPVRFVLVVDTEGVRQLLVCAHHTIVDGRSLSLIVDEIGACYRGEPPSGPVAGFDAFTRRVAQRQGGPEATRHEAHWRERLLPLAPSLDLPGDHARPAKRSFRGATVEARLDGETYTAARRFCVAHRCTPAVFLLGAYLLLLHRLSGQDDLVVGMPVSGRVTPEDEEVVGFCAQMMPVRSRYRPETSVVSWFTALRETILADSTHATAPLARVLDLLRLPFDASRAPLFVATFNLDSVSPLEDTFGCATELIEPTVSTAKFDLSLNVTQLQGEFRLRLEFALDLFEPPTAGEMLQTYMRIVQQIVTADADQPLAEIELRTDDEVRRMASVNDTARELRYSSVVPWFFERAEQLGGRTAYVDGDVEYSFADVAARAAGIATALSDRAIGIEEPVGVCLGPGVDLPCALLGVIAANGSYVPLEPTHPHERLHAIRDDVGAGVIVTSRAHEAVWRDQPVELLFVEDVPVVESRPVHLAEIHPQQTAYVIYTSGSTGKPKGVGITHAGLVNLLASMEREPGLSENDVLLSITPISFDIAGLELFLPLLVGATLVIAPAEVRTDGAALGDVIERCSATVVQATPSTLELLLDSGWQPCSRLMILCGGEALPGRLAGRMAAGAAALWNMYGPTETTIWSTVRRVRDDDVDIGSPIDNTLVYVTDGALSPVPTGVVGELWIGGAGLARGYHGRPALTAERFVPDPFSAAPGRRMYRSGDRVRWRRDGGLEVLGRIDDQLKVRGVRVEPAEIEAVLCDVPPVKQAAVCSAVDANGEPVLVAHIVVDGDVPSAEVLRAHLSRRLPTTMIPQRFERLDRMPTTPSGKLDRVGLAARPLAPVAGRGRGATGDVEAALASIWADVLGVSEPGVDQNFFDLGGTSLAMGRVHARAQERFGRSLPLIDFLQFPTIHALAASLGDRVDLRGSAHVDEARRRAHMRRRRLVSIRGASAPEGGRKGSDDVRRR